jgi:hypothetical protein
MKINELLNESVETLYVSRNLTNTEDLVEWAKTQGFKNLLDPFEMHVTVAFSKKPFETDGLKFQKNTLVVNNKKDRSVEPLGNDGAIVLKFSCDILQERWQELKDAGASYDYPIYIPHVTLSYKEDDSIDLTNVEPYLGKLIFGPENDTLVDNDWKNKVKNVKV